MSAVATAKKISSADASRAEMVRIDQRIRDIGSEIVTSGNGAECREATAALKEERRRLQDRRAEIAEGLVIADESPQERDARLARNRAREAVKAADDVLTAARAALSAAPAQAVQDMIEGVQPSVSIAALRRAVEDAETNLAGLRDAMSVLEGKYAAARAQEKGSRADAAYTRYFEELADLRRACEDLGAVIERCDAAFAAARKLGPTLGSVHDTATLHLGDAARLLWSNDALRRVAATIADALEIGPEEFGKRGWTSLSLRRLVEAQPAAPTPARIFPPTRAASSSVVAEPGRFKPSAPLTRDRAAMVVGNLRDFIIGFRMHSGAPTFREATLPFLHELSALDAVAHRVGLDKQHEAFPARMRDAWTGFGEALVAELDRVMRGWKGAADALAPEDFQRIGQLLLNFLGGLCFARDMSRQPDSPPSFATETGEALAEMQRIALTLQASRAVENLPSRLTAALTRFGAAFGAELRRIVEL